MMMKKRRDIMGPQIGGPSGSSFIGQQRTTIMGDIVLSGKLLELMWPHLNLINTMLPVGKMRKDFKFVQSSSIDPKLIQPWFL
mmetsp:Transcript_19560/g.31561  ORF Transcript_19560/g.31561 Transcript_19560/m.31561 type:complete len:83 (+) Transcript_19560:95-343(+)